MPPTSKKKILDPQPKHKGAAANAQARSHSVDLSNWSRRNTLLRERGKKILFAGNEM